LQLAAVFERPCFLGPLALQQDLLQGMHGNTHLPVVVGLQQRYELTGEEDFRAMVRLPACLQLRCPCARSARWLTLGWA
jgi:hypothetical protein